LIELGLRRLKHLRIVIRAVQLEIHIAYRLIVGVRCASTKLPLELPSGLKQGVSILIIMQGVRGGEESAIERSEGPVLVEVPARLLQLPVANFPHRFANGIAVQCRRQVGCQGSSGFGSVAGSWRGMRGLRFLTESLHGKNKHGKNCDSENAQSNWHRVPGFRALTSAGLSPVSWLPQQDTCRLEQSAASSSSTHPRAGGHPESVAHADPSHI
jgi:hypothetical protein